MEDIQTKYSALTFEFSRLRSRFQSLRQHYINIRTKNENELEEKNLLKRRIKRLELEIDGLKFRNEQFIKRISFLQTEVNKSDNQKLTKNEIVDNRSQELDIFIETTKSQLSSIVQENEELSQKVISLQSQIEADKKGQKFEIDKLLLENLQLKTKINKSSPNADDSDSQNFILTFPLPRNTIQHLESIYHNCFLKLYGCFKDFVSEISDHKLLYSLNCNSNIIQLNFSKLYTWIDLAPLNRSRVKDSIDFVNKIYRNINLVFSIISYVLKEYSLYSNFISCYLTSSEKCLLEFQRVFQTLILIKPTKKSQSVEKIENFLLFLREKISRYSSSIEKSIPDYYEDQQFDSINLIVSVFNKYKIEVSKSLHLLNIIIDNELSTLRLYGWFPFTFNSTIFTSNIDKLFLTSYQETMDRCLKTKNISILDCEVPSLKTLSSEASTEILKTLDEHKNIIYGLKKTNEKLNFELNAQNLLSNNIDEDNENSRFIKQMKEYIDTQMGEYFNENQKLSSQIVQLKSDLNAVLNRIRLQ